jgi:hypothetical protein
MANIKVTMDTLCYFRTANLTACITENLIDIEGLGKHLTHEGLQEWIELVTAICNHAKLPQSTPSLPLEEDTILPEFESTSLGRVSITTERYYGVEFSSHTLQHGTITKYLSMFESEGEVYLDYSSPKYTLEDMPVLLHSLRFMDRRFCARWQSVNSLKKSNGAKD